ncbi:MAG: Flp family type IVb pilin [Actinobacteria bacterium]|nr:Flp family type IVb pilin [Actinomycetota bacterium]
MIRELLTDLAARARALRGRLAGQSGASAVEYSLLVALIAGVIILVVTVLGQDTSGLYNSVTAGW